MISHRIVQGYNARALVDDKHQIILHGGAFGNAQDQDNLKPMLDGAKENLTAIRAGEDYFQNQQITADSNYDDEKNLEICDSEKLDAYIPDPNFRKRDARYAAQERFREGVNRRPKKGEEKKKISLEKFQLSDFTHQAENDTYLCPIRKCRIGVCQYLQPKTPGPLYCEN